MWFIFPQLRGLGRSSMAEYYGISSLAEARAYLAHPVLGPRLDLCTRTVLEIEAGSLHGFFGSPDDMKFRSCATLFALAAGEGDNAFQRALSAAGFGVELIKSTLPPDKPCPLSAALPRSLPPMWRGTRA
jgi:uncharacterized protein (DUF1810 family)